MIATESALAKLGPCELPVRSWGPHGKPPHRTTVQTLVEWLKRYNPDPTRYEILPNKSIFKWTKLRRRPDVVVIEKLPDGTTTIRYIYEVESVPASFRVWLKQQQYQEAGLFHEIIPVVRD
jgi:hypothetical protein